MAGVRPGQRAKPSVITDAVMSPDDELAHRRRRYLIMMLLRALCVLGAGLTFQISLWFVAFFLVGALSLPWIAVLSANDRPAKKAKQFRRFLPTGSLHKELAAEPDEPPPAPENRPAIRIIDL